MELYQLKDIVKHQGVRYSLKRFVKVQPVQKDRFINYIKDNRHLEVDDMGQVLTLNQLINLK